ncbi:TPA: hypothetical protein N0F65_008368, partial [Lagenidium giganteum]
RCEEVINFIDLNCEHSSQHTKHGDTLMVQWSEMPLIRQYSNNSTIEMCLFGMHCFVEYQHQMRNEFHYTMIEYGNYVFVLKMLTNSPYEHGQSIAQWLQERRNMRQQLTNMGYPMSDDQLVDLILANVAGTHWEVVRSFSRMTLTAETAGRPTLAQVMMMNALMSETELDEALTDGQTPAVPKVMGVDGQSVNGQRRSGPGNQGSASSAGDANAQSKNSFRRIRQGKKRRFDMKFQNKPRKVEPHFDESDDNIGNMGQ